MILLSDKKSKGHKRSSHIAGEDIELTDHAIHRMIERNVGIEEVIETLRYGRTCSCRRYPNATKFKLNQSQYNWCCNKCEVWVDDKEKPELYGCKCESHKLTYEVRDYGNRVPNKYKNKSKSKSGVCVIVGNESTLDRIVVVTVYRLEQRKALELAPEIKENRAAAAELIRTQCNKCA